MSKWNVGKPPVTGWYLVADSMTDQPYCAYYTKSKGWRDMDGDSLNAWVTHWMPTPPMPTATVKPDSA